MKIWKAELILIYSMEDNWETDFSFKLQEKDFKANKEFKEWTYFKDWVGERIPMEAKVEYTTYGCIKVVQGFNYELSKEEQSILLKEMKELLKEYLKEEKDSYLKTYNEKINSINKFN